MRCDGSLCPLADDDSVDLHRITATEDRSEVVSILNPIANDEHRSSRTRMRGIDETGFENVQGPARELSHPRKESLMIIRPAQFGQPPGGNESHFCFMSDR